MEWRPRKPLWMATWWKQCYMRPPPSYFIVLPSSVKILEVDIGESTKQKSRAPHLALVHRPDRVTVHPPPPQDSLGPMSKVDSTKKKLGWTTRFGPFSKWLPSKSGNHVLCHNLSYKAVKSHKIGVYAYVFGAEVFNYANKKCFCLVENL